ncbi:hypothetical protein D922_00051 [Enterococcus faecalis 06-MB-DW-09]|nr:hypothetical protein D922_00051 [Enterococcus faecalis 06-MB-DW-09]
MEVKIITGTAEEVAKVLQATEEGQTKDKESERLAINQYLKERKDFLGNWTDYNGDPRAMLCEMDASSVADSQGQCDCKDCKLTETTQCFMEDLWREDNV